MALGVCRPALEPAVSAPSTAGDWHEFQGSWSATGTRNTIPLGRDRRGGIIGVFLDVGIRGGVPARLMAFALLFASSYFSVITPQGGSQHVIFVASGYLQQRELYRLGLLVTLFFLAVFMVIGTAWILMVT